MLTNNLALIKFHHIGHVSHNQQLDLQSGHWSRVCRSLQEFAGVCRFAEGQFLFGITELSLLWNTIRGPGAAIALGEAIEENNNLTHSDLG